ncbi:MAG TPA: hypothetical protein VES66_02995 [Terriglobales bacterium]|nr:hypothetical protein [Terriglobales bacterium]
MPPFFLPPFFVAMVLFSLPFFMDATNVPLHMVIECIELMKNEVKRKIGTRRHLRAMYAEEDDVRERDEAKCDRTRNVALRAERRRRNFTGIACFVLFSI